MNKLGVKGEVAQWLESRKYIKAEIVGSSPTLAPQTTNTENRNVPTLERIKKRIGRHIQECLQTLVQVQWKKLADRKRLSTFGGKIFENN